MWQRDGEDKGSFDESGYKIDYIFSNLNPSNSIPQLGSDLQALCLPCFYVKKSRLKIPKNNESVGKLIIDNADIENYMISYLDFNSLIIYAQLSKINNIFIKKNVLYNKLFSFNKDKPRDFTSKGNLKKMRVYLMDWAAGKGYVDVLKLCMRSNINILYTNDSQRDFIKDFASYKSVKNYKISNLRYSYNGPIEASHNGHINVLNLWKEYGLKLQCFELAIRWASGNGHVNVLEWWKQQGKIEYSEWAVNWASGNGHTNVLQWWKESGLKLKYTKWAIETADERNHTNVLIWWANSGLEINNIFK